MVEPGALIGNVIVGAAQKIGEVALKQVFDAFRSQTERARRHATENTIAFLVELDGRIRALEAEARNVDAAETPIDWVRITLEDPDVSSALRDATDAAARSSNPRRHNILARALVERMTAQTESSEAVASTLAIEAVPRLSADQLDILGLLAALTYIGPVLKAVVPPELLQGLGESDAAGQKAAEAHAQSVAATYVEWLIATIGRYEPLSVPTDSDLVHLAASGCLIRDTNLYRDLTETLMPPWPRDASSYLLYNTYQYAIGSVAWHQPLRPVWEERLQHAVLTPAGLLIGAFIHDWRTQEISEVRLGRLPAVRRVKDRVWDGRRIDQRFMEALMKAVERRIARGRWV